MGNEKGQKGIWFGQEMKKERYAIFRLQSCKAGKEEGRVSITREG